MISLSNIAGLYAQIRQYKQAGQIVGLVPTMGNLHLGHLSLIDQAKEKCDKVVVSIFINPKQFSANEDFDSYPRTLNEDLKKLQDKQVDLVFTPTTSTLYPKEDTNYPSFKIDVGELGKVLCGRSRPHFFQGVALVVLKLFNLVQPELVFFGEKDYQQLFVIKKLVHDFNLPITVHSGKTVRERDGLAMSSRNRYLTADERTNAPYFYQILSQVKSENDLIAARIDLKKYFQVDYLEVLDADTLSTVNFNTTRIVAVGAIYLGSTRLIDNHIASYPPAS